MIPLLAKPFVVMGILNVTPDSFYDGGKHDRAERAVDHGLDLVRQGADIIDVGGESTRPGAEPVPLEEECRRVIPVIGQLVRSCGVPVSIDTTKSETAARALDAGAKWINDISAGRFDPRMPLLAAQRTCPIVLMHSRATPKTMQQSPLYGDVVTEVREELRERVDVFLRAGVERENIVIDPGIGFGKRGDDNLLLIRNLQVFAEMGFAVLVGTSRKSFIGQITGKPVEQRLWGTLGSAAVALMNGAKVFRVHDVAETVDCLAVASAILGAADPVNRSISKAASPVV